MKHLPPIDITVIPHANQRYATVGDYFKIFGNQVFQISEMKNPDYEACVLVHELVEWLLTEKRGIKEKDITKFDKMFEKEREQGKWEDEEPGHDPRCPYRAEHQFAEKIERLMAKELGVIWKEYDLYVNEL
jgi:hypothetical protein